MKPILQVERALAHSWARLPAKGRIVLAVSGGVDSMVLLEACARMAKKTLQSGRLLVAHVNHSLRGAESDADEAFVRARAQELGIESRSSRIIWHEETPSQNACRIKREAFFVDLMPSANDRLFLAHHLNDQAETLLFRLIRGTGAKGLKGMLPESARKLRPFLGIEKSTLQAAAQEWNVRWREDSSNLSLDYERNWVRSLFPLIEKRRPGFQRKLAALAEEARSWRTSSVPEDAFSYLDGISFSRPGALTGASLSETYSLSRRHTLALQELLQKSSGRWEAEGVRFTWSAGVLLAERDGARFSSPLRAEASRYCSGLGTWDLGGALPVQPRGESVKKEFQALRVPVFFRPAIPLVAGAGGKPLVLLPKRLSLAENVLFTPSPLGAWWLRKDR